MLQRLTRSTTIKGMETTTNQPTTLPDLLRGYRKKHRLSAGGLADLLGVTRQTVSRWECQTTRPAVEHLASLSKTLGVELSELVTLATKETT